MGYVLHDESLEYLDFARVLWTDEEAVYEH